MDPLIITATPNICWLQPQFEYPNTIPGLVEEAKRCEKAGASVLHIHADNNWAETIQAIRARSALIVQCGMSSLQIKERIEVFEARADMISIITSHHDEAFAKVDMHVLHPREELIEYASLSQEYGVRLEFEIWHTGSIWNLNFLIKHEYIKPPYITTLFFGWPGGSWTPPTVREYLYRREYLPEGSRITASIMSAEQVQLLTTAIMQGDHVRVGTEDYPFGRDGKFAPTHQRLLEYEK
ncbi:3-keto-5-aminohexanoate cleavage protein [Chloroflexota bacterium]